MDGDPYHTYPYLPRDGGEALASALRIAARRRLIELDARLIRYEMAVAEKHHGRRLADGTMQWGGFDIEVLRRVENLHAAQALMFLCPKCFEHNGGSVGTHMVLMGIEGRGLRVEQSSQRPAGGGPSRWRVAGGTCLDNLTLEPSIHIGPPCRWEGEVKNGAAG